MIEMAERLPARSFILCADGAYACLAGNGLPRTTVVSRMRRDAALFGPPPPPTGKRGRPRTKGERLPTPPQLAARARGWKKLDVDWRGRTETKLVWSRPVLWHGVRPKTMVRLVVVRDPSGREPDDFFFTTDLDMTPGEVVSVYADAGPSRSPTATSNKSATVRNPRPGKAKAPSEPPTSLSGSTARCGSAI
jgi:hypothetical protein